MKKMFLLVALCVFTLNSAFASTPVGSGDQMCVSGYTSVRHFMYTNFLTGAKTYYGPYYYFSSPEDAHNYIIQMYPPVAYPDTPAGGANVVCYSFVAPEPCCP